MTERTYSISETALAFDVPVSTLRYYDEIGLVPATTRRSRVRHYDRAALERLAYVQLWRHDGLLSVEETTSIVATTRRAERNELLKANRDALADLIERLGAAKRALEHMLDCPSDDPVHCTVTGVQIRDRVETALSRLPTSS